MGKCICKFDVSFWETIFSIFNNVGTASQAYFPLFVSTPLQSAEAQALQGVLPNIALRLAFFA